MFVPLSVKENNVKIAVTSQGTSMESAVDPRLGRAAGFIVTDETGETWEYVDNVQNLNAASGAGIQAAQTIIGLGVGAVVTGNCGPKAFSVLAAGDVKVYTGASGTVQEAVAQYAQGELKEATRANVEGHW
jgi:predicted Fe-Mo cluster-binding NifX family protein